MLFVKAENNLINRIISWITQSDYVHAALVIDNDWIIETTTRKVEERQNPYKKYDIYEVLSTSGILTEAQAKTAVEFARAQLGDFYDWGAIFYLGWLYLSFQRKRINQWNLDNKWFCSELVSASFRKAGIELCPKLNDANVSPEDLASSKLTHKIKPKE